MKKLLLLCTVLLFSLVMLAQPNYYFSSGTTSYTALSGGSTFTWTGTADEGYSSAINIFPGGENFTYDGTVFTQFQVSTNGFLKLGTGLAAATPIDALNSTLRNVLAPLWDDLDAVSTANITYQVTGSTPSQVLSVEWQNVKWNKSAASANAQFQIKLYENDGHFEFIYGTMGTPNAGAASIGINDATASGTWGTFQSINVGGGGTNFHVSMVYVFNAIANAPASNTILTFTAQTVSAMSGTYTVGGATPDFATLSQAAQALNLNGVSDDVTLNVRNGTYDDIMHLINVAGTSPANTITIQKESGTVTLSPRNGSRTGSSSTSADFVVALLGTDYTTFDGIDIQHNSANNGTTGNAQFEFGYWLSNFTATDGAQNNTIKNAHIVNTTLGSNPTNFRGIRTSAGGFVAATNATGATSYNTFKNIKIDTTAIAIYISGQSVTIPDLNNIVTADGGYSGGNTTGYNDIGNITISTTASGLRGIYMDGQDGITVEKSEFRNIINTNTASTSDIVAIAVPTTLTVKVATFQNNLIHGLSGAGTATQVVYGIWLVSGTTVDIKRNKIYDLQNGTNGATGTVRGILNNVSVAGTTVNIINNMVYDLRNPLSTASNYSVRCLELNSNYNVNLYNNTLYLDQATTSTGAVMTACLYIATSANMILDMRNNILVNKSAVTTNASSKAIALAKTTATIGTQIATTTDNNLLYAGSADTKHLIAWDATTGYQTLATYQAWLGSPRELNAIVADPGFVDDVSPGYDMHISSTSWVPNGQGVPIVSVTNDFDGNSRSTSLPSGPIDIGADEYTPTGIASTSIGGTIGDGNTQTFAGVDNKTIAKITWHVGSGTLPSSVNFTYTPGEQATGVNVGAAIYRSYTITSTGGISGWNADIELYYNNSTELKGFAEAIIRINKKVAGIWNVLSTTHPGAGYGKALGVTSFSEFTYDDGTSAVPVELGSFSAKTSGNNVNLKWLTISETRSSSFEVQRKVENAEWVKIGEVTSAGNSNSPKDYSFTDKNLSSGKYQYRLKMIDVGGTYDYSNIVDAEITLPKEFSLSQNYPNPFNPTTQINYSLPFDTDVRLDIYSVNGELVRTLVNESQSAGSYNVKFDASDLASGTYIYRLIAKDFAQTKKMQLIK